MTIRTKLAVGCAALVAVIVLFSMLVMPGIIRNMAITKIETATGRTMAISKISLNPFTLSAKVSGVRMTEKGTALPFVSFSSARISVSPVSLFKRALIVSELQLSAPTLHIVRTASNIYNFSDLLVEKGPKPKRNFLFSINNIVISNGSLDFSDQAISSPTTHTVRHLGLAIPFISNIPYLADHYVAPRVNAVVNGAPFTVQGRLKPLSHAVEASFDVNIKDIDLPFYLAYLPYNIPVKIGSGRLSSDLEITYRISAQDRPDLVISGNLLLDHLTLLERSGAPLLSLDRLRAKITRAGIMSREYDLAALESGGLEIHLSRDGKGIWSFQKLLSAVRPAPHEAEAVAKTTTTNQPETRLNIASLRSMGGKLHFTDHLPPNGFRTDLEGLDLMVTNLSTLPQHKALWELSFHSALKETLAVKGEFTAIPLALTAELGAKGVVLDAYYPYLATTLAAPVKGTMDISSRISFDSGTGMVFDGIKLEGRGLAAAFGDGDGVSLALASLSGGKVNLKERSAVVETVELKGGACRFSKEKEGGFSPQLLLKSPAAPASAAVSRQSPEKPFSFRLIKAGGSGLDISFTDKSREEKPTFSLNRLRFSLANISGPKTGAIPFTFAAGYGKGGTIRANGNLTPTPLKLAGDFALQRIPLRDFDAYQPETVNVFVADGAIDTHGSFNLAETKTGLTGSFKGGLGIRSFYCLDKDDNEDLLKWESLQLDEASGTLGPFSLSIREVALNNVYSRIIVKKDGTLNLQHLLKDLPPATSQQQPDKPAQPAGKAIVPSTAAVTAPEQRPIKVGMITIQDGTLAFSDLHLPTGFATTFYNLGGRVSGLSSEESRFADVDLRGNLENHSPLTITGTINPLRNNLFVDLKVGFTDIELSPMTPYSGTYLGYTVDKGKLFLDLKYRIENKSLTSENRLFIDQFTFGSKVESDRATSLPVRLAVALLKDRKGEIHLDLPVSGRTDDPKFSAWGVIWQMLKNLLVKAATSPFTLLQSAFGGKEDFSSVAFTPGSAQLAAAEQEKLSKLAQAVHDRPELNIEITGFVDREKDAEGYRNELLLKKMKNEKFLSLAKAKQNQQGQTPDTMEIMPTDYATYLKAVYKKEPFPKPRTILGLIKDLPDPEMKKLIIANTTVGNEQLQNLARDREAAVKRFLLEKGGLEPQRLFLKTTDIYAQPTREGTSGSRVELGAGVK